MLGWLYAVGWLVSGFWWLYISMHDYRRHAPRPGGAGGAGAGGAAGSLLRGSDGALGAAAHRPPRLGRRCCGRPAGWLAELARGLVFTGFPWIASGYAHAVGPLAAWAPWIGVYGLCARWQRRMGACRGAVAAGGSLRCRSAVSVVVVALALVPHLLPDQFTRSTGTLSVSLLQPNVPQDLKFDPDRLNLQLHGLVRQLSAARGALVVTPESVLPLSRTSSATATGRRCRRRSQSAAARQHARRACTVPSARR